MKYQIDQSGKRHQKTAQRAVLVNLVDSLKDWTDNLEAKIAKKGWFVQTVKLGVDLPGIGPGRFGLSVQSSEPARPTSPNYSMPILDTKKDRVLGGRLSPSRTGWVGVLLDLMEIC